MSNYLEVLCWAYMSGTRHIIPLTPRLEVLSQKLNLTLILTLTLCLTITLTLLNPANPNCNKLTFLQHATMLALEALY